MRSLLRVSALPVLVSLSAPAFVAAQARQDDVLLRRVETLERRANELERRVRELESPAKTDQPRTLPAAPTGNPRLLANWRRLRKGMTEDDVRSLLGEPQRVMGGTVAFWYWGEASVTFYEDRVDGWKEPGR